MRFAVTVPLSNSDVQETLFESEADAVPRAGDHLSYEDEGNPYGVIVERVDWVFGERCEVDGFDELYAPPVDLILRCRRPA